MAVYVDTPNLAKGGKFRKWCNLVADSVDELQMFVDALFKGSSYPRMKVKAFIRFGFIPYVLLSPKKRLHALRLGAISIGWRKMKDIVEFYQKKDAIQKFLNVFIKVNPQYGEYLKMNPKQKDVYIRSEKVILACKNHKPINF